MKLKHFLLGAVATVLTFIPSTGAFATTSSNTYSSQYTTSVLDTDDFYFEDFTADYYLTKLDDNTSSLHVKEVLTAVFPESDQNHGITRDIPYANQDGKNIRQLAPQTDEYQTYAKNLNIENIQYFNPLHEADAKLLSSQKGIHIKTEPDGFKICNANKKLCSIPLSNYDNKSFFYGKAYQHNPVDAIEYINSYTEPEKSMSKFEIYSR